MKSYLSLLVIISLLFSCKPAPDISGTWIEAENFIRPAIIKYWDNKFWQYDYGMFDTLSYSNSSTEITYNNGNYVKYELIKDTLFLLLDNYKNGRIKFERFNHQTYYEHFINKYCPDLNLPEAEGLGSLDGGIHSLIMLNQNNDRTYVIFNGKAIDLNESVYQHAQNFYSELNEVDRYRLKNYLIIDSKVEMKHVIELENYLRMFGLNVMIYIVNNRNPQGIYDIRGIGNRLPQIEDYKELKSGNDIITLPPPPPPPPLISPSFVIFNNNKTPIFEVKDDRFYENGKETTLVKIEKSITKWLKENPQRNILFYPNPNTTYGSFIQLLSCMHLVIDKERDSIARNIFDKNLCLLDDSSKRLLKKKYYKAFIRIQDNEIDDIRSKLHIK